MGDRIAFRGRARGCVVAEDVGSIQAVSLCEPRVKYVKGWLTGGTDPADGSVECGDGSPDGFCMLVTVDQLEEIMYLVKDATCTSGTAGTREFYQFGEDTGSNGAYMFFTGVSPGTALVESEGPDYEGAYTSRGYCTVKSEASPAIPMEDYDSSFFSETSYLSTPLDYSETPFPIAFREAVAERAMWAGSGYFEMTEELSAYISDAGGGSLVLIYSSSFRTGFSLMSGSWTEGSYAPSIYTVTHLGEYENPSSPAAYRWSAISLQFSGRVAWVDVAESGNPLDPANELYIGVELVLCHTVFGNPDGIYSTRNSGFTTGDTGKLLKLKLSGEDNFATAKIYGRNDTPTEGNYWVFESVTDWIFEATEWWQYKTTAGDPAWNAATGEPANGGPGA